MINRNELYIKNRIAKLRRKPVENAKIIKKWERIMRKLEA